MVINDQKTILHDKVYYGIPNGLEGTADVVTLILKEDKKHGHWIEATNLDLDEE